MFVLYRIESLGPHYKTLNIRNVWIMQEASGFAQANESDW
jgi:hypothetical protein